MLPANNIFLYSVEFVTLPTYIAKGEFLSRRMVFDCIGKRDHEPNMP